MALICIDLDGTIEDSRADMSAAINRLREDLQLPPLLVETARDHVCRGMEHLYKTCFGDYLLMKKQEGCAIEATMEEIAGRYEEEYARGIAVNTKLYPGMKEVLQQLGKMAPLVVVTNKPETLSAKLLNELGVAESFTGIVGPSACPEPKPSPQPLRVAQSEFGEGSNQAVMIGDSAGDLQAGKSFGAKTVWCSWGYYPDQPAPCDSVANQPDELPKIVEGFIA